MRGGNREEQRGEETEHNYKMLELEVEVVKHTKMAHRRIKSSGKVRYVHKTENNQASKSPIYSDAALSAGTMLTILCSSLLTKYIHWVKSKFNFFLKLWKRHLICGFPSALSRHITPLNFFVLGSYFFWFF